MGDDGFAAPRPAAQVLRLFKRQKLRVSKRRTVLSEDLKHDKRCIGCDNTDRGFTGISITLRTGHNPASTIIQFYNFFRQLNSSSLSMWYPLFFHSSRNCCNAAPISFPADTPIFLKSWPLTGKEGTVHSCISLKRCSSPWYFSSSQILEFVLASLD